MLDSTEAPGPRLSLWPRLVGERAPTLWSAEAAERSWAEVELGKAWSCAGPTAEETALMPPSVAGAERQSKPREEAAFW